jgi:hypothetical protein
MKRDACPQYAAGVQTVTRCAVAFESGVQQWSAFYGEADHHQASRLDYESCAI